MSFENRVDDLRDLGDSSEVDGWVCQQQPTRIRNKEAKDVLQRHERDFRASYVYSQEFTSGYSRSHVEQDRF